MPAPKDLSMEDVTEAYRSIAMHPALVSGRISMAGNVENVINVKTEWSQRDIDQKEKTHFVKTFSVKTENNPGGPLSFIGCSLLQEFNNILWDVMSPSEKKRALIVKKKDKKGEEKQFIEIWNLKQKIKTIDVKALDTHGDIVGNDGQFGSVQWSKCENYLLYVAEKKKPKTTSFFETSSSKQDDKDKGDSSEATVKGGEYLYRESWGEQLVERHLTTICRLDVNTSALTLLTQVPDQFSPGQALWGPDNCVLFVGWSHEPFRLGLKFCVERTSFLFKSSFDGGDCESLSEEGRAVRCPSLSPDESRLVYLDTANSGAHNQCSRLLMIDWKKWTESERREEARQVIVDIVSSAYKGGYNPDREEFPGLYTWADAGCLRSWLDDNVHFLLTTYWRSRSAVVMINTNTKHVHNLYPFDSSPLRQRGLQAPPTKRLRLAEDKAIRTSDSHHLTSWDDSAWNCSLLDVKGRDVLLNCSWPDTPQFPVLGHLKLDQTNQSQWMPVASSNDDPTLKKIYDWKLFVLNSQSIQAVHEVYDYLDFEAILYLPPVKNDGTKPPLVLFPHGGPHSAFDCGFNFGAAVLASCGFAVLCVNYRGSLGFGQDNINSLLGHIGDFDVKDCMLALRRVQETQPVDVKNTFVYGGSHGGFLSAHLIGQYPDEFRAASMRNPVTNLTSMFGTSDIPDWVFTEAGMKFEFTSLAKGEMLSKLWDASPISHIEKVKTPVMLNIGLKDLRVPPSQGLEYCKMLKARSVPVQCHVYPDSNHSLAEVDVEADCLVNTVLWFAKHISTD